MRRLQVAQVAVEAVVIEQPALGKKFSHSGEAKLSK